MSALLQDRTRQTQARRVQIPECLLRRLSARRVLQKRRAGVLERDQIKTIGTLQGLECRIISEIGSYSVVFRYMTQGSSLSDTIHPMNRRQVLRSAATVGAGLAVARSPLALAADTNGGRLKQGVSYWTYQKWFSLDELCKEATRIGLKGIDLVTPDQYATVKSHGLVPSMTSGTDPNTIPIGLNRLENHERVLNSVRRDITL